MALIEKTISVTTATPEVYRVPSQVDGMKPYPLGVRLIPGASGTLLVATSRTPGAGTSGVTPTWVNHPNGAVSVTTDLDLVGPVTAIRITAATSTGTVEICA